MRIIHINESNETGLRKNETVSDTLKTTPCLIKFYSPTCPHCIAMTEAWKELEDDLERSHADMDVACINVHADRIKDIDNSAITNRIKGFPTILSVKGLIIKEYQGDRGKDDMLKFLLNNLSNTSKSHGKHHIQSGGGVKSKKRRHTKRHGKSRKHRQTRSRKNKKSGSKRRKH
jgi:thiol-disulfide isomerase/thioredoxin